MRRAVKFNYTIKTILQQTKLCEENMLTMLHEILGYLMLENGIDSDLPNTAQLAELRRLEESGVDIKNLTQEQQEEVNRRVF